jgi:hypothetical protein
MERDNLAGDDAVTEGAADATVDGAGGTIAHGVVGSTPMGNEMTGTLAAGLTGSMAADDAVDTPVEEEDLAPMNLDALDNFSPGRNDESAETSTDTKY